MTQQAPDTIWATGTSTTGSWNSQKASFKGPIETVYTRTDLTIRRDDPKLLALVEALQELLASTQPDAGEIYRKLAKLDARTALAAFRSTIEVEQ